jgi:hypothetical protein
MLAENLNAGDDGAGRKGEQFARFVFSDWNIGNGTLNRLVALCLTPNVRHLRNSL